MIAALDRPPAAERHARYELAGPDVAHPARGRASSRCAPATAAAGWSPCPAPVLRPLLRGYEALAGPTAVATWDEAELLGVTMRTPRGTADAEALGVHPRRLAAVLGA